MPLFTKRFYANRELAELLDIEAALVTVYCVEGLVPHCRKINGKWIVAQAGAQFIAYWLGHRDALGYLWRKTVGNKAALLDPSCRVRQQEHAKAKHAHPRSTIKPEDLLSIRAERASGKTLREIAESRTLSESTISKILSGDRYAISDRAISEAIEIISDEEISDEEISECARA